jgi:DNA-binding PadR family transcriptional regulator
VDYAILATLWNGPATLPELVGAVYDRIGKPVNPSIVDSHLRLLERSGFIEHRTAGQSSYVIAERGSVFLAYAATA